MKTTTIVGIFDNARDLDKAVERLSREGFEDAVFDGPIVAEEPGDVDAIYAPGSNPALYWGNAERELKPKQNRHVNARAFKAHLAEYHLPDDVIEGYATTFDHDGEFVLVKASPERAEQALEILRTSGASRANRHDV
ncbi:MAG TPA: hypothetical protein VIS96_11160 [Terrimicrobiaceae bacterium]